MTIPMKRHASPMKEMARGSGTALPATATKLPEVVVVKLALGLVLNNVSSSAGVSSARDALKCPPKRLVVAPPSSVAVPLTSRIAVVPTSSADAPSVPGPV